jgi:F-type H+-transporting ATPase subunit b
VISSGVKRVFALTFLVAVLVPEMLLASGGGGGEHAGGSQLVDLGWRVFNFVIFAVILYFAGAKPAKNFLGGRIDSIREQLEGAEKAKDAAEKKAADCLKKIEALGQEVKEIHDTLKREGEVERDRIIEAAEEAAAKIREQAEFSTSQELKKAVAAIKQETAEAALVLAEKMIVEGLNKNDQKKLVSEYLDGLGSVN